MTYPEFFERVTGNSPYPYQERMGTEPWPDLLDIPTGLGKTAAVVVAWLWKRLNAEADTPRRLVYCLPMRSLVEQTHDVTKGWLETAEHFFAETDRDLPRTHKLLGGDVDNEWMRYPETDAILIGTQDMLLSRALMRGYGISLYTWPIHFGFLHFDSLWLFDEVQLMGPGMTTSSQLEAFRITLGRGITRSRSLWCSATITKDWLGTVDYAAHLPRLTTLGTGVDDESQASKRLNAAKSVEKAKAMLSGASGGATKDYASLLAEEVRGAHRPGTRTIVILNTVDRAQAVYRALDVDEKVLIHSRFRPPDRESARDRMLAEPGERGLIVVATQVIEAGVDVSSATLFTELCPWSSFVQRIGRCNRAGEYDMAEIRWVDLDTSDAGLALPYEVDDLERTRQRLAELTSASPASLPRYDDPAPLTPVLRKRDLLDLFSTDSDLSGFHTDVSDYIRDSNDRTLQVFWRQEIETDGEPEPSRDELCSTSLVALLDAKKNGRSLWVFDPIAKNSKGRTGVWHRARGSDDLRPGVTLMLDASEGAYTPELGFDLSSKIEVAVLWSEREPPESIGDDPRSRRNYWMTLEDHLEHTRRHAAALTEALSIDGSCAEPAAEAALWHDVGKLHSVFQDDLLSTLSNDDEKRSSHWAKGSWKRGHEPDEDERKRLFRRRFFRHELPGALAYLEQGAREDRELVAYLIAAHHGKVRTSLRAIPTEPEPTGNTRRYARGVWDGDELSGLTVGDRIRLQPMTLSLELMDLGGGDKGRSWNAIVEDLIERHGPFELALLEAIVRIADWRASGEAECWCSEEGEIVRLEQ